jgi:hypothetical protein
LEYSEVCAQGTFFWIIPGVDAGGGQDLVFSSIIVLVCGALTHVFDGFSLYGCCRAFCQSLFNNKIKEGRMHLFDAEAGTAQFKENNANVARSPNINFNSCR